MDETEFRAIIDSTREDTEGDPEEHAELFVERLIRLDPEFFAGLRATLRDPLQPGVHLGPVGVPPISLS